MFVLREHSPFGYSNVALIYIVEFVIRIEAF